MKSNVEKEFNAVYKEAGKKRSRSLQGTYWGISDVIDYFESKNILYTYMEGENEITIHNRFATKANINMIKENTRYSKIIKREKNTTIILL